jgi:hypothetical protein
MMGRGVTNTRGVLADPPILVLELAAVGTSVLEIAPLSSNRAVGTLNL